KSKNFAYRSDGSEESGDKKNRESKTLPTDRIDQKNRETKKKICVRPKESTMPYFTPDSSTNHSKLKITTKNISI
ncbi:6605_t:CDS:2, partial [Rhizophagus irregularis]